MLRVYQEILELLVQMRPVARTPARKEQDVGPCSGTRCRGLPPDRPRGGVVQQVVHARAPHVVR